MGKKLGRAKLGLEWEAVLENLPVDDDYTEMYLRIAEYVDESERDELVLVTLDEDEWYMLDQLKEL